MRQRKGELFADRGGAHVSWLFKTGTGNLCLPYNLFLVICWEHFLGMIVWPSPVFSVISKLWSSVWTPFSGWIWGCSQGMKLKGKKKGTRERNLFCDVYSTFGEPILKTFGPISLVWSSFCFIKSLSKPRKINCGKNVSYDIDILAPFSAFKSSGHPWSALSSGSSNGAFCSLLNSMAASAACPTYSVWYTSLNLPTRLADVSMDCSVALVSFCFLSSETFSRFPRKNSA